MKVTIDLETLRRAHVKLCRAALIAAILLSGVALEGKKKMLGTVTDAPGLNHVHTFCLDSSELNPKQSAELRKFARQAAKPDLLFDQVGWKLVDSCSSAEATVKLSLEEYEAPPGGVASGSEGTPLQNTSGGVMSERHSKATMLVTSSASGRTLYKVHGKETVNNRPAAFADTFTRLMKDLD